MKDDKALTPARRQAGPAGEAPVPAPLSGRAKAVIVVRLLLNESAELPLENPEALGCFRDLPNRHL